MRVVMEPVLALDAADGAGGGIAAFHSILHLSGDERPKVFSELRRVLAPGGLLLAFHVSPPPGVALDGDTIHAEEFLGHKVTLDARVPDPVTVCDHAGTAPDVQNGLARRDLLRSARALDNIVGALRSGGRIVAVGVKRPRWWLSPLYPVLWPRVRRYLTWLPASADSSVQGWSPERLDADSDRDSGFAR